MLAAGEMLATRIVTVRTGAATPGLPSSLNIRVSRADGLWLADATDLSPLDLPRDDTTAMPDPGGRSVEREDHALLSPMLGITHGRVNGEWMTAALIDGAYLSGTNTRRVRRALNGFGAWIL
jgi:hypothetical protein